MRRTLFAATFIAAIVAVSWTGPTGAQDPSAKVILLVVDKLAAEDFIEFPEATAPLHALGDLGATGLLNVRTGGGANSANGYLSLSTGTRAVAGSRSGDTYSPTEQVQGRAALEVYTGFTGHAPTGQAVHLGIGQLRSAAAPSTLPTGTIGQALADAGLTTALLGNGDVPGQRIRLGGLLAMNHEGIVPHAVVGDETVLNDPAWPTGMRTNYPSLFENLWEALRTAHFVVVDLADLARLEDVAPLLDPPHAAQIRETALENVARFVQSVLTRLEESGHAATVYLASPSPPQTFGRQGILMTPIFRWSPQREAGLLTSPTTRRPGIVTNFDFLPSILAEFGLDAPGPTTGRPWTVLESPAAFLPLLDQYVTIREVHMQRLPIIQPYFFTVLGMLATGVFLTIAVRSRVIAWSHRRDTLWKATLSTIAAFPWALLILSAFPIASLAQTSVRLIVLSIGIALGIGLLLVRFPRLGIPTVGLVTAITLVVDTVTGASLMQGSLLGYDPVSGSRFYGIGNEYMGVLLGSSFMAIGFVLERQAPAKGRVLWPSVFFIILTGVMAHPRLGVNLGGAITAATAAVATYIVSRDQRITVRQGFLWTGALTGGLVGIALADMTLLQSNASHLGRAAALVSDGGADPLWDIVSRKIAVNVRLIRLTIWSRVALGSLALLSILFLWPNWLGKQLKTRYPWLVRMCRAALVSALVTMVVNDSGVVAAATLLLWPALALLSVAIHIAWQDQRVDAA